MRTEKYFLNVTAKVVAKINTKKTNSIEVMNRNTPNRPKSMKFLHKRKIEFRTISYMKECCYAYRIYTKIVLDIGNYNILQYTILRQLLRHVASLLGNN